MKLSVKKNLHHLCLALVTAQLAACGSKLTEPVKVATPLHLAPAAQAGMPAPYSPLAYGVPEVSRVHFNLTAQTAVQDLTY